MTSLTDQIVSVISAYMERNCVTQRELARRSGVPQPTISALLAGKRWIGRDSLDRLAAECECRIE